MPEQLLGRIIRACSNPDDLVIDPFAGSATTLAVAKKLGRRFIGFELSAEYVERGTGRLQNIRPGDPLDGAPEPLVSAPITPSSPGAARRKKQETISTGNAAFPDQNVLQAKEHLIKAYKSVYDGYSLDRVLADPELGKALWKKCHEVGLPGTPKDWNFLLMRLRKAGKLIVPVQKRTEFSWSDYDEFLFASEIAWSELKGNGSLDDILCDPELADKFDEIARSLSPGFSSLQYRWGALTLRKKSKTARVRSGFFAKLSLKQFKSNRQLRSWTNEENISNSPGLYLIKNSRQRIRYVGSALDLQKRLDRQFGGGRLDLWEKNRDSKFISFLRKPEVTDPIDLLSMQQRLIQLAKPTLNVLGPTAA